MLVFTESFEWAQGGNAGLSDADKWNSLSTSYSTGGGAARTGSRCMANGLAERKLRASEEHATLVIGAAWKMPASGFAQNLIQFLSDTDTTIHVTVRLQTDGSIAAYRGTNSGTLLGASAAGTVLFNSTYQYVEAKVVLSDTVGSVVVRLDEMIVLSLSSVDTKNGGTKTAFDAFNVQTIGTLQLDDVYACNGAGSVNNDFLGAVKIEALIPSGNGNSSQGVGSDGNSVDNYALVSDAGGGGSTYVDLSVTGDKDTYVFSDSTQPSGNAVKGVMPWAYADKTDAGARALSFVARLSSTETTSAADALVNGVFHTVGGAAFETKPAGGAWTVADVNNAEFGIQAA